MLSLEAFCLLMVLDKKMGNRVLRNWKQEKRKGNFE
jgi:hypothetical protein